MDIVFESGAASLKAAPCMETVFVSFASLTYILVRSVSEMSIVSLNAMISSFVFLSRIADAISGLASVTSTVRTAASSRPQPLVAL